MTEGAPRYRPPTHCQSGPAVSRRSGSFGSRRPLPDRSGPRLLTPDGARRDPGRGPSVSRCAPARRPSGRLPVSGPQGGGRTSGAPARSAASPVHPLLGPSSATYPAPLRSRSGGPYARYRWGCGRSAPRRRKWRNPNLPGGPHWRFASGRGAARQGGEGGRDVARAGRRASGPRSELALLAGERASGDVGRAPPSLSETKRGKGETLRNGINPYDCTGCHPTVIFSTYSYKGTFTKRFDSSRFSFNV